MANGRWLWDDTSKALRFEKDKTKSFDLRSMEKFKYKTKSLAKRNAEEEGHRLVTLNDVKRVALDLITEESLKRAAPSTTRLFDECYQTESMDALVWCVLRYYSSLLKYRAASCDKGLEGEGTVGEKARSHLKQCSHAVKQCESDLSAGYILLVSGISLGYSHHTLQGKLRYSRTLVDRHLFEVLYEFLMLVTWVTFNYQNWECIHTEIGRILRSDAFNRDIPLSSAPSKTHDGLRHRDYISARVYDNRPETGNLKKLKSPLAEVLYPTLNDSSSLGKPVPNLDSSEFVQERLGVIGDDYSNYIPETLRLRDEVILQRKEEEMKRQEALLEEQEGYSDDDDDEYDSDVEYSILPST